MTECPDLILANGRVFTCDRSQPWAEALAIYKGRIIGVGESSDIENLRGNAARYIDLDGALVIPGISDNHTHFLEGAINLGNIDLQDVDDKDELLRRVQFALDDLAPGEWLAGGFWNEERWGGEIPDKSRLDPISPDNPVLLFRRDMHQAVCNSSALAAAEITSSTPDPDGGVICRGAGGEPTGVLLETAFWQMKELIPSPARDQILAYLRERMQRFNSVGITHIGDMITSPEDLGIYFDLEDEGALTCRFILMPPIQTWERFARAGLRSGIGTEMITLGPMKGFIDGSLGSRTAYMFEPYDDDPGNRGLLSDIAEPLSSLEALVKCVDSAGFSVALHAIGDAANRMALDLYEKVRKESPFPGLRHRIEHAQHLHPDDIPRFRRLNLTAACQPFHLVDDGCFAEKRIGKNRARYTYAFRSLMDAGVNVTFGSDWPVVDFNPFAGIWAAVTRQTSDGANPGGWVLEEKVSVQEAITAYTAAGAYTCGKESRWGRLSPGLEADLIVLDRDIFTCDPDEIFDAKVLRTFVGGTQVYPAEKQ